MSLLYEVHVSRIDETGVDVRYQGVEAPTPKAASIEAVRLYLCGADYCPALRAQVEEGRWLFMSTGRRFWELDDEFADPKYFHIAEGERRGGGS